MWLLEVDKLIYQARHCIAVFQRFCSFCRLPTFQSEADVHLGPLIRGQGLPPFLEGTPRQGVQLDRMSQELQGHLHGPGQPRNQGRLGNRPKDNPIGSFFLSKVDADLLTYFIAGQIRNSTTSLVLQYFHRN